MKGEWGGCHSLDRATNALNLTGRRGMPADREHPVQLKGHLPRYEGIPCATW
jgi:hypothetical protein